METVHTTNGVIEMHLEQPDVSTSVIVTFGEHRCQLLMEAACPRRGACSATGAVVRGVRTAGSTRQETIMTPTAVLLLPITAAFIGLKIRDILRDVQALPGRRRAEPRPEARVARDV
jgi:hypothetical protein